MRSQADILLSKYSQVNCLMKSKFEASISKYLCGDPEPNIRPDKKRCADQ